MRYFFLESILQMFDQAPLQFTVIDAHKRGLMYHKSLHVPGHFSTP